MDSSFTLEEQRFVLAEMIKSSTVDIGSLAGFVKSNCVPNWMTMQVPLGRNIQQCMHAAEVLSISSPLILRPVPSQNGHSPKDAAYHSGQAAAMKFSISHHTGPPSATLSHVTILPRTANDEDDRVSLQQTSTSKKRGRPPRVDRRDLPHTLPPIAPRPPRARTLSELNLPRLILPRVSTPSPVHVSPVPVDDSRSKKRRRITVASVATTASSHTAPATTPATALSPIHIPSTPFTTSATMGSVRPASHDPKNIKLSVSDLSKMQVLAEEKNTGPESSPRPVSLKTGLQSRTLLPTLSIASPPPPPPKPAQDDAVDSLNKVS